MTSYVPAAKLRIFLAATLLGSARGQIAPAPAATTDQETPIQLSPFTVTTDKDVGYIASNSLAGSRLNTGLKDTAASISVLTEEFLSDLAATDLATALGYATNVELELNDSPNNAAPNGNVLVTQDQSFRVRGMPATQARDFFESEIPTDTYNVARIEDSRGPNAVLFGVAQAGGLINTSSKQPVFGRDFRKLSLLTDSYDSFRGTLDVNQVATAGKLAVRFNAVYDRTRNFRRFIFNENRRGHLAVKYLLRPATSIRAEFERGFIRGNVARPFNLTNAVTNWLAAGRPTFGAPVATNAGQGLVRLGNAARVTYIANSDQLLNLAGRMSTSGNSTIITDPALTDRSINVSGPGILRSGDFTVGSVYLEHQFARRTFLEVAATSQKFVTDSRDPTVSSSNLLGDPNRLLPNGAPNPYAGGLLLEAAWNRTTRIIESDAIRATLTSEHDARKWGEYRFVALGEYTDGRFRNSQMAEYWDESPFNATPENGANLVYRRNYVTEGDWGTYYINGDKSAGPIVDRVDPVSGRTLSSVWFPRSQGSGDQPTTQEAGLMGMQARYFGGRLIANVGYRYDHVTSIDRNENIRDPVTNRLIIDYENGIDVDFTGETKSLGLVGHVTRQISLLGNYATNHGLPNPRNNIVPGTKAPARLGQGSDVGAALTLFDGRIYARAIYYETAGQHLAGARGTSVLNLANDRVLEALVANALITSAETAARDLGDANVSTYDLKSSGYEFQVTANPARNWRFIANFSITKAREENVGLELKSWAAENFPFWSRFDQNIVTSGALTLAQERANVEQDLNTLFESEGVSVFGNRRYKVNAFTRYTFSSGPLQGISAGAGYKHQSKIVIGRDATTGTVYGNSFSRFDAMLGYDLRAMARRLKVRLQLNVTNVLDNLEPLILRYQGTEIRRYKLADPREWRLSASFDF